MGPKIVIDTNVYISALGWGGSPHELFCECLDGKVKLYICREIVEEIVRVMDYPKFNFSEEEKGKFLSQILEIAEVIEIHRRVDIVKDDPSDNIFLACALEAGAEYLVSGDPHLRKLKQYEKIKIISAEKMLKTLT